MNRKVTSFLLLILICLPLCSQTYKQVNDISYTNKIDSYAKERLKLDIYYPEELNNCPVIVWFHGGGLEAGNKEIPNRLKEKGYVVVGVNYRLLPNVSINETLDDSAEAIAWVFRHVSEYNGDPNKIVVTGHSAGGYISMMLCLNKKWLSNYQIDADDVLMYVPFSSYSL